jgi:outer membrane usher protein
LNSDARIRFAGVVAAALALATALPVRAAELGKLTVLSKFGQPLVAEIEIDSYAPATDNPLAARLAPEDFFEKAGLAPVPAALGMHVAVASRGERKIVRLTTEKPVWVDPLAVLVELQWGGDTRLRGYAVAFQSPSPALHLSRALGPSRLDATLAPREQPGSNVMPRSATGSGFRLKLSTALSSGTAEGAGDHEPRLIPLQVFVNGTKAGDWVLLDVRGRLYATSDAFEEWRVMRSPQAQGFSYRGQPWYPLDSVAGYEAQLNSPNQSINLKFSPTAFSVTRLAAPVEERPAITPPLTSLFTNYDLSYTYSAARTLAASNDLGLLGEIGLSGTAGVLTSSYVGRNLGSDPTLPSRTAERLETAFTRDFPENNTSLRIGDSSTRLGTWGRQYFFGGVQFGRNFALSPGLITQPLPVLLGTATAPSTVELYVNDALRQTSQVPSGPFTIDNYPLLTGTGQARLVVRDLLGRETVLVQNFFSSTYLLKQGLSDWGVQAGAVRRNLGLESANYGEGFASGLWRYGINNDLTLETQAEASRNLRGAGVGVSTGLFGAVLGQAAVAVSSSDTSGSGTLWALGAEHLSLHHGFTLHGEGTTRGYRRIGQNDSLPNYSQQWLASYSYFTRDLGQVGAAYARVITFDTGGVNTYSANYTTRIGGRASLTFTATRVSGPNSGNAIGLNFLIPLDNQTNATGSALHREGRTDSYVSASKTLGLETGTGWRALAGHRLGDQYAEGGYYVQGSHGLATADVSASREQQTARLGAQGGLIWTDGELFASRKVQDSFAVVEVPGYPNVGVGFQSTVLTHTDAQGKALVPRLMPYRRNAVRLDPNELPISAELDTIELVAVPPDRSGVKLTFPVRSGRGALITIHLENGEPAPAGAEVELAGDTKVFYVARRGEAFVTGLKPRNTLRLKWKDQSCSLAVELPPGDKDEIARLGPYVCAGVKP